MEIEIRDANGARIKFVGDTAELDRFVTFLREEYPNAANGLLQAEAAMDAATANVSTLSGRESTTTSALSEMLQSAGATTDIERITVMAQLAASSGGGLSAEQAERWYTELGIPKPGRFPSTLSNAKSRGYIHYTAEGWKPTAAGENFALHGIRRPAGSRRRQRREGAT
jgi:hypothetical protein